MKKDQYFPHEVNLRQTSEFMQLIEKEGMAGYGIYWGIIEYLRSQENYTGDLRVLKILAKQMNTKLYKVEKVIRDYNLFTLSDFTFSSAKLDEIMSPLEKKRKEIQQQTVRKSEAEREQTVRKSEAECKQMPCNSLKTSTTSVTVKKSKEKESKENTSSASSAEEVSAAVADVPSRKLPWEEYVDELDKEQQWKEIMAMRSGLKMDFMKHYPRIVECFKDHVCAQGRERTILSTSDAKSYFCNYLSPGSYTYKHLMAQLGTSPEKVNPYRFEELDPHSGQRSYCGVPIPENAPPRPNAQAAWNSEQNRWVF